MRRSEEHQHILALQQGSVNAFRALYDLHFSRVHNYCRALLRVQEDVEEIVSEVFVTLWRRRSTLDESHRSLQPLLFKITKDLAWNHLRKISASRQGQLRYLSAYPMQSSINGEDAILLKEQEQKLEHALKELTPQQEKVFKMRFFQGRDLNQIATQLQISKNTVKVHLAKSKQFIVSALTQFTFLFSFL